MIIILAVIVILVLIVGWLLSRVPEGEEIENVGFVRKDGKP